MSLHWLYSSWYNKGQNLLPSMMNCNVVWSWKSYANPHPVNRCRLLSYNWLSVSNMITVKQCIPFIVCHNLRPLHDHIQMQRLFSKLASQALMKENNVMNMTLPDKRQSNFHLQQDFSKAASMNEKDEVTFGCSIKFKALCIQQLSKPHLFCFLLIFLLHLQNSFILILCIYILVENVCLSTVSLQQSKSAFSCHFYIVAESTTTASANTTAPRH